MHSFHCTSWHNLDGGGKRESNPFTVGRLKGCRRRARLSRGSSRGIQASIQTIQPLPQSLLDAST